MHVRVKAPNTGHEFDVPEDSILLNRGLVRRVKEKAYPPARYPRRPKHHLKLAPADRKSTRLNSSHVKNSYAVFCLKNITWTHRRHDEETDGQQILGVQ